MTAAAAILLPLAKELGLPLLRRVLEKRVGARAADLTDTVLNTVADKLGVGVDDIVKLPGDKVAAVLPEIEDDIPDLLAQHLADYNGLLRAEQKSRNVLQANVRPLVVLTFSLCSLLVIVTACLAILRQIHIADDLLPIIGLVIPTLTVLAGVSGYYVRQVTGEKKAGVI
ncbi:MAG: hypothetical protein KDJ77_17265 [Rhodobiaceae bacterium]|nr:hypothetical protein [Rhodobiaceae bacterium]